MNPLGSFPHNRLTGVLKTDEDNCKAAAGDFGQIVSRMPIGVLVPADYQDISVTLKFAAEAKIPVSIRGRGHSCYGQTQVDKGIVIDMRGMTQIHSIDDKSIVVDAGATWQSVVERTVANGLTPPILTDFLGLTVGGTLSVGGTGGRSHRFGMQIDQVLALEIVSGDGTLHHCTPDQNSQLFYAALAGFGQCGIICRVTLKLIPAPQKVSSFRLVYPNAEALLSAQTAFLDSQPFDHMEGWMLPSPDGWLYTLEAAVFHDDVNAPASQPPAHVRCIEQHELSYLEFLFRLGPVELFPCIHQSPRHTHPGRLAFFPHRLQHLFCNSNWTRNSAPQQWGRWASSRSTRFVEAQHRRRWRGCRMWKRPLWWHFFPAARMRIIRN